jgi:hypothetical protein
MMKAAAAVLVWREFLDEFVALVQCDEHSSM